ncbi:hypothetical protein C0Q70_07907 [Pomacea canaliculata]|uniref:Uncharacterized protein n=1 Tax=Pomacea canaliculata TaxID=400727 RepID=A0A2T7PGA9_POMCA|nr:hypothetical protein C0Q70_07907 [Pomacea canaliculata]
MRTSTSWDEKIHHQVVATPTDTSHLKSQLPATDLPLPQSPKVLADVGVPFHAGQEISVKDRRRRFNKSNSLDSTVGTCIARAGMQALGPPAVPAAFSPSDMLTSVKAKLTPVIRSKTGKESDPLQARPPSPLFIQTSVPDIPLRPSTVVASSTNSSNLPATATADTSSQRSPGSENPTLHEGQLNFQSNRSFSPTEIARGRDSRRPDERHESRDIRWRSQSADRATRPPLVHSDVLVPAQVWQFSETAV